MKKILALVLALILMMGLCTVAVSAEDTSIEKQKLKRLLDCNESEFFGWLGMPSVYYNSDAIGQYNKALTTYNSSKSDDASYATATTLLLNADLNKMYVVPAYAKATYEMALAEQNYNNWYTEEQWSEFTQKINDLKVAIDSLTSDTEQSSKLTKAFHSLLKTYNEMTNAHTLVGDVNKDNQVNVMDVTLLQKYLVDMENLTGAQKMLSGSRSYDDISIIDVTELQKHIAGLVAEMPDNNIFISDLSYTAIDEDLLMERVLNFNICPRNAVGTGVRGYIQNGYMGIYFLAGYYKWCIENEIA